MVGSWRRALAACCVLLVLASSAAAFGGRPAARPSYGAAYAAAPVWCCYYVIAVPPCWGHAPLPPLAPPPKVMPPVMPLVMPLAKPLPAPPSTTTEPPLNPKRGPTISESRSHGGAQAQTADLPPGRCKVGFWNITGGEVTLTIDGQTRTLAKDRALTLNLPRNFVWRIGGREAQSESVPEGQNIFEVILRP